MVNFNLSKEEKNRILSLHESHKRIHGTIMSEQVAPTGQQPTTAKPTQSKYKLPEITDDTKFKTFVNIEGSEDIRPSGLLNLAYKWYKDNVQAKRATLPQEKIAQMMGDWSKWATYVENMAKNLLVTSAYGGYNAESFKTLSDDVIIKSLERLPKPSPEMDWNEIIESYVGNINTLKNGMSLLITQQLNKIK